MIKPLFTKRIALTVASVAGLTLLATPSFASRNAPVAEAEPVQASPQGEATLPRPTDNPAALAEIANQVRANFANLEGLMATKQYGAALTQAKALLDDVRIKSGIHPKASYREKVALPAGTLAALKTANQDIKTLPIDTQDTIALTVANHRAGYFLDILNLMKRVNLIYIRAFQQTLKARSGKLLNRDIEKIRQDILDVHAVPLYLKDAKLANYYLIFDFEVANSDQSYLFNRELMDYVLSEGKDLDINGEADFEKLLANHIAGVRAAFTATLTGAPKSQADMTSYRSDNFKKCHGIYSGSLYSSSAATVCEENVKRFSFIDNPEFDQCFAYYVKSLRANSAADVCIENLTKNH